MALAGCGNKETKEALQKASVLEDEKQYEDANTVLIDALEARETKIRAGLSAPTDPDAADALTKKVQSDPEILKMERAQITIYLRLEREDKASAVYSDVLAGHPGDPTVPDMLHDKDPKIRAGAVRVLGLVGKPESIPPLAGATKDEDQDVRRAAVAALGTIKNPAAVDPLLAALKDSYWFVRSEAATSLGLEHDPRAIKPLIDTVADADSNVESSAESALLQLCQTTGTPPDQFVSRLGDSNPKIVMVSAICLVLLKDPRAVPVLTTLTASSDLTIRLEALKGLGETGDPSVLPTLRQSLTDPDVNVKGWSIIGLGKLKDHASLTALQAMAADAQQTPNIRAAASAAVEHITGIPNAPAAPPSSTP